MIRPYPWQRLPRLERSDVRQARLLRRVLGGEETLAGLGRWAGGCLGSSAVGVKLVGAGGVQRSDWRRSCCAVALLAGPEGRRAALALDAALVARVVGAMLGSTVAPPRARPTAGELGLVSYAVAWLLGELPLAGWTVVETVSQDDATGDRVGGEGPIRAWEALISWEDRAASAWLVLADASVLEQTALRRPGPAGDRPAEGCPPRLAPLAFDLAVVSARCGLARDELGDGLATGDLVVAPGLSAQRWTLEVGAGGFPVSASGEAGSRLLSVDGPYDPQGALKMAGMDDVPTVAGQLPVELAVEIGRVRLEGAEVVALGQGDIVTLDRPVGGAVDLRVGGRLLARGELVDVDGEAGVRVLEVYDGA